MHLGQLYNHCLPECRGHSVGKGGEVERIFEICNDIHEKAFSLYAISKTMLKRLIDCS